MIRVAFAALMALAPPVPSLPATRWGDKNELVCKAAGPRTRPRVPVTEPFETAALWPRRIETVG
jgi:hypothetical protein